MRTGMVLLLIGLFFGCTAAEIRRHSSKPNIILIMADDAGVEAFGCYGGQSYPTPVIDGLATSGVRFTNCHSQPLCTPSRVKIMTGMSNIRNYKYFSILDPELETFGPMLKSAGYVTAAVGKWQLYGTEKYPESYLIDPRGNLQVKFTGPKPWGHEKAVEEFKQLLEVR